ncbi:hypothetical protein [Spirosoma terrae]|uniref:Uncharacterized protein n=1 Tax=Spirosoma terrae TaxID=1968276 RepID=A0A6L9LBL7_9BACT|nr:hypothetical protein [Spirosoma terrae]NDU95868.1 hypothetical protein [Spirosoma terrae]
MTYFSRVTYLVALLLGYVLTGCQSVAESKKESVTSADSAAHCVAKGMPSRAAAIRQVKADML